ncbi:hypothetical protein BLNAU_21378 [Blattamonas nauphoetae]|uniref:Uncharacterized protein n=1 Tax=Blattamonas nauphoetae TaxID=2049346 RepID=A0ABQ9WW53_9EUKA|nr:hypothetical protein BLNAU_21378 [Blattamonas nauphoetae]
MLHGDSTPTRMSLIRRLQMSELRYRHTFLVNHVIKTTLRPVAALSKGSHGTVLIEAGVFEETESFDLETKNATFSSFGDISPIISFSLADDAAAFITKGTGTVRFELLHFVPSSSAHVILQNGDGNLEVWNCSFVGTEDVNAVIRVAILKATEGTVSLASTTFSGLTFADAHVVECVGSSTKLEITLCQFMEMKGATPALIVFEPLIVTNNKARLPVF